MALLALVGGWRGQQDSEQTRLGQIFLSVRSVLTFSAQRKGTYVEPTFGLIREENETNDRITYTYAMTQRLNVTQIEDRLLMFGSTPDADTMQSSLTIEGGGQESGVRTADGDLVFRVKGFWTYGTPPENTDEHSYVHEIILGGPFKVIHPHPLPQSPEVTCGGTTVSPEYGSHPYKTLGLASSLAPRVMNRALKDPGFIKQFEGTAPDNESGFQVSRQAQFSASGTDEDDNRPGININWTGRWEVHYTLGYAPETKLEAVIVPPENYEGWMPTGDKDEDTPSLAQLVVTAKLRLKDKPGKEPSERAKFKFELIETSKEPGLCLNAPKKDKAKKSFDLKIRQKENPELEISDNGQTATSKEFLSSDIVVIRSYDWGAYAKMKVTATLDNGQELAARLEGNPQKEEMVIPLDENNNRVADGWEKEKNVYGKNLPADWDGAEEPQGQKARGDGISLYEKFRGFEFEGIHERLDPNHKYLFVHDPDEIVRLVAKDKRVQAMNFKAVSKLRLRFIDDDHWTGPGSSREKKRIVNFNTGWKDGHAVDQHALDLKVEEGGGVFPKDYLNAFKRQKVSLKGEAPSNEGFCFPDTYRGYGAPRRTYQIMIFSALIRKNIVGLSAYMLRDLGVFSDDQDKESLNFIEEYIRTHPGEYREVLIRQITLVLSHEMSHGVGVEHHEEFFSRPSEDCVMSGSYFFGNGGLADPLMLNTYNVIPDKLCLKYCWPSVIVSDLADEKAGK
jgi:hypothetical protein